MWHLRGKVNQGKDCGLLGQEVAATTRAAVCQAVASSPTAEEVTCDRIHTRRRGDPPSRVQAEQRCSGSLRRQPPLVSFTPGVSFVSGRFCCSGGFELTSGTSCNVRRYIRSLTSFHASFSSCYFGAPRHPPPFVPADEAGVCCWNGPCNGDVR